MDAVSAAPEDIVERSPHSRYLSRTHFGSRAWAVRIAERQMTSQLDLLNVRLTPEQLRFVQDYKSPGK